MGDLTISPWRLATCIGCGCNDHLACWDDLTGAPCHWLRLDRAIGLGVCSCCQESVAAWDAGSRTVQVPANQSVK